MVTVKVFVFYIQHGNSNTEVTEEVKEEREKDGEIVELGRSDGHKDSTMEDQPMDGSSISLERSPHPLHSQDSIEEEHRTTPYHQGENLNINIKVEEDAQLVLGDRGSTDDKSMAGINQEKDLSSDIHTAQEHKARISMEGRITRKVIIFRMTKPVTLSIPQGLPRLDRLNSSNGEPSSSADGSDLVTQDAGSSHEKRFKCIVCGECCKSEAIFQKHWRVHAAERVFPCSECNKSFRKKERLVKHLMCHSDERPYACSECDKTFKDIYKLKIHTKFHTGVDLHTCSECGKQFGYKKALLMHQVKHTGEKPYSCPECEEQFPNKYQFYQHRRSHTGEKPHTCPECGKQFADKSGLNAHKKIHTGDKPHRCSECGKGFLFKSYLTAHQRIHTGEKPYVCSECGQVFARKHQLGKHKKKHTADGPTPSEQ